MAYLDTLSCSLIFCRCVATSAAYQLLFVLQLRLVLKTLANTDHSGFPLFAVFEHLHILLLTL